MALVAGSRLAQLPNDIIDTIVNLVEAPLILIQKIARGAITRNRTRLTDASRHAWRMDNYDMLRRYNMDVPSRAQTPRPWRLNSALFGFGPSQTRRLNPFALESGQRYVDVRPETPPSGYFVDTLSRIGQYNASPYSQGFGQIRGPRGM